MRRMLCPSSLVAALLCASVLLERPEPAAVTAVTAVAAVTPVTPFETCPDAVAVADGPVIDARLAGLWQRYETLHEGDAMRFYFFHPDGFGIYRYGKVGLTNTHSFDWSGGDGVADLRFRKTGEGHAVGYRFEQAQGREWLVLAGDPREDAAQVRYFRVGEAANCAFGPLTLPDLEVRAPATGALGNRLWGEEVRYATGGMGFAIYQLQPQAIDGRGVGWFHKGDYDEWTTESLTFRQQEGRLKLDFPLRHESQATTLEVWPGSDGVRRLRIDEDPRDFWRAHTYRDMGPSFACVP